MPKRKAFTLIEVMVAVMIVSVVIAALLQMQGNTHQQFFQFKKILSQNAYTSFMVGIDDKYGYEKSHTNLQQLVDEFDLERPLRRKLQQIVIDIDYTKERVIDTSEETETEQVTPIIFEIGTTQLHSKVFSTQLQRIKIQ